MAKPVTLTFVAGATGMWRIERTTAICGEPLPGAARLDVIEERGKVAAPAHPAWMLSGVTSNARYARRDELDRLAARQEGLGRSEATCAALIPIRKSEAWWALAQDERRAILEENSRHIAIGLEYLPAIARRLCHARDLGETFDFLTWFEFAPEHASAFDRLLEQLRATPEWRFVERETEIRLSRAP